MRHMSQNLQFTERLAILTDSERKLIYELPKFALKERKFYFNLEKIEEDILREKLSGLIMDISRTAPFCFVRSRNLETKQRLIKN